MKIYKNSLLEKRLKEVEEKYKNYKASGSLTYLNDSDREYVEALNAGDSTKAKESISGIRVKWRSELRANSLNKIFVEVFNKDCVMFITGSGYTKKLNIVVANNNSLIHESVSIDSALYTLTWGKLFKLFEKVEKCLI